MHWEIIDNNGTIHSGTEDEMLTAFDVMGNSDEHSKADIDKYYIDWVGDLKLVQVINVVR
jgi:hypothetical protein